MLEGSRRVDARLVADELPDVAIETLELFLNREEGLSIGHGRRDFQPVADDARIAQQLLNLAAVVARDALRVKFSESFAIVLALVENRVPAQPGLRSFEDEEFEQNPIAVPRHRTALLDAIYMGCWPRRNELAGQHL